MSSDLFVLLCLGALLVFILWEGWRNRQGALARRARTSSGFTPGGASRELALYILAAVFSACGLLAVFLPGMRTAGPSVRIVSFIESSLGANAVPLLFLAGAAVAFVAALAVRKGRGPKP
jgi:hypothetical protein